jgi:hypothetical protein
LKYVRFCDLTQVEHDKLLELIDMIEYSLSPTVLPVHHEPMTKANEFTLQIPSVQAKTTGTKLEKQGISPIF